VGVSILPQNVTEAEKKIKRIIVKLHQDVFGKGPEQVWVKFNKNMVTFYCSQSLTDVEEFLLTIEGGEDDVKKIREKIFNSLENRFCMEITKACGADVLSLVGKTCMNSKSFYGTVLLEKDFE